MAAAADVVAEVVTTPLAAAEDMLDAAVAVTVDLAAAVLGRAGDKDIADDAANALVQ